MLVPGVQRSADSSGGRLPGDSVKNLALTIAVLFPI
jgi:hypothetical protein